MKINLDVFPEKIRKFFEPGAPKPLQMMLARGMVPMQPGMQICALAILCDHEDEEVATAAKEGAQKLPLEQLRQQAAGRLPLEVLDWMAHQWQDSALRQSLALNPTLAEETFVFLAQEGDEAVCEICAQNQQRILADPAVVQALYFNRNARASTIDRTVDFAARNNLDLSGIPCVEEVIAAISGENVAERTAEQAATIDNAFATMNAISADEIAAEKARKAHAEGEEPEPEPQSEVKKEETPEETSRKGSAIATISQLNVAQRVRLAILGTQGERMALITDPNKIVSRAVIRSPGVQIQEALQYAHNKSLPDEIVAFMAGNKKWTRYYQMRLALVQNPKTPLATAITFLSGLRAPDLRIVARSKGIPQQLCRMAKEFASRRG